MEDHARGIDCVLRNGVVGESYNIGGINEWANIDIVNLICDLMNENFNTNPALKERFPQAAAAINQDAKSLITFVTDRPGHDRRYAIDPAKANKILAYTPKESFETGIKKTVAWYLENPSWWLSILDGSYRQ